jgi:hypothetical protein
MSFKAYFETIQQKTGLDVDGLKAAADAGLSERGRLKARVKAGQVVHWLQAEYGLGGAATPRQSTPS